MKNNAAMVLLAELKINDINEKFNKMNNIPASLSCVCTYN